MSPPPPPPPPRRSSRLRDGYSSPSKATASSSRRLSCLMERDETSNSGTQSNLNPLMPSPVIPHTPEANGRIKPPFEEMHPGKSHSTSSPSFNSHYTRPVPAFGPDAQRMMDEIREEALRIKVQLAAQREEEKRNAVLEDSAASIGRRIATPKGKMGRFSEVHIAAFKKMDSIAGHASAFRGQPGRFPVATASLKRSQSKAKLGSREEISRGGNASSRPQSVDNTPAKRPRTAENQYSSQNVKSNPATPKISRSQSILSSITTPTQASLARAASVKQRSQFPAWSQSPSKDRMVAARGLTKSATINNIGEMTRSEPPKDLSTSHSKFDRFKSIIRRPIGPSKPAVMVQKSVPLIRSPSKPNLDKELPSIPANPEIDRSKSIKNANVMPSTTIRNVTTLRTTQSPPKSENLNLGDAHYPSLASKITYTALDQKVEYPRLASTSPYSDAPLQAKSRSLAPSMPGNFTFRSDQTIDFGFSPRGFGASPGQSSIRQVRPSIIPCGVSTPGFFRDGDKENFGSLPATPQGISNKKRHRVDSDDEHDEKEVGGSPAKRRKGPVELGGLMEHKLQAEKLTRKSRIPSPTKKGVLSLTRLNLLARPKLKK